MKNLKLLKDQVASEDPYYIRKTLDPNLVRDFDEHKKRYKSVLDQINVKNVNVPTLTVSPSTSTDQPVNPFVVHGARRIGLTLGTALKGFFESLFKGWKTN